MFEFKHPLPQYKCHKVVGALKIKEIKAHDTRFSNTSTIVFEDQTFEPVMANNDFIKQFKLEAGGYLVQYVDGYVSFSPAKAFEEGYTLIEDNNDDSQNSAG